MFRVRSSEQGYILIAVLFVVTLLIISLAIAVPSIRTQIQRDREDELIHRAHQYTRAIQLYFRKFGRYPSSLEQLEDTNNLRFLRHKYTDPITGKDEWRLIRFGTAQPKPRPAYLKGATSAANLGTGAGSPNGTGSTGSIGSTGGLTGPGISNASDISKSLSGSTTFGGGAIVGVASLSEKEGLKEIDGKTKYSEWEFVYDPTLDNSRGGAGGTPAVGTNPLNGTGQNPPPPKPVIPSR